MGAGCNTWASLWMPNDGEVWAPNKRSLIWLGDIHALLDSDVVARTELWCQGELQRGNQPIMHPLATVSDVPNRDPYPGKGQGTGILLLGSSNPLLSASVMAIHIASEYGL